MQTKFAWIFSIAFGVNTFGAGAGMLQRGGLGFLFPDHNSFVNPGQFGESHGTGIQALYTRDTASPSNQLAAPSIVYGNGMLGLGAFYSRPSTSLTSSVNDSVGGGLGIAMLKGKLSFGVGYSRTIGSSGAGGGGLLTGTLTLNPTGHKGASVGFAYSNGLGLGTSSVTAGVGYAFMSNNSVELNFYLPSLASFASWTGSAYFNVGKQNIYLGAGYILQNALALSSSVAARLGFVLGSSFDLSLVATYGFASTVSYGATLRAGF